MVTELISVPVDGKVMKKDAFSTCHPAVNFLFFVGAIGFGVVIQHPAYLLAGVVSSACYYLLLHGKRGWKLIFGMFPLFCLLTAINPLFNTSGETILFHLFGRPYTLEALYYGMSIAGMFVVMMLWFSCYNAVLTSDKFICLFGSLIPALSLILVMVLRMIPNFMRKSKQIAGSRKSIGKGANINSTNKEKMENGMTILSSLTDWALEGSVVTADSMRARGYGCAKRTSFQIYRMTPRDWILMGIMMILVLSVILAGGLSATFTPELSIAPLCWGFGAYCIFLLIPTVLQLKEAITWRILISRI